MSAFIVTSDHKYAGEHCACWTDRDQTEWQARVRAFEDEVKTKMRSTQAAKYWNICRLANYTFRYRVELGDHATPYSLPSRFDQTLELEAIEATLQGMSRSFHVVGKTKIETGFEFTTSSKRSEQSLVLLLQAQVPKIICERAKASILAAMHESKWESVRQEVHELQRQVEALQAQATQCAQDRVCTAQGLTARLHHEKVLKEMQQTDFSVFKIARTKRQVKAIRLGLDVVVVEMTQRGFATLVHGIAASRKHMLEAELLAAKHALEVEFRDRARRLLQTASRVRVVIGAIEVSMRANEDEEEEEEETPMVVAITEDSGDDAAQDYEGIPVATLAPKEV